MTKTMTVLLMVVAATASRAGQVPDAIDAAADAPYDMNAVYHVERPEGVGTGPTLHVATTGKDTARSDSASPLRSLAAAVARVKPGGVIVMHAGTYQGAVVNQGYGTSRAWVTLRAAPGEAVVLQGNPRGPAVPTLYFYNSSCDEYAPPGSVCVSGYWRVENLKIMGYNGGGGDSNAVKIDVQHVQIANSVLCCALPDVVKIVRTANDAAVLNSELYADAATVMPGPNSQGVDITGADRVRIVGNFFHDLPDIALYAKGNAREPIFAANRINNTGTSIRDSYNAIMLGQQTDEDRLVDGPYESYDGLVVNNVISNVSGACLGASSSLNAKFYHNTCYRTALRGHGAILVSTEGGISYTPNKGAEFINNLIVNDASKPRMIRSTDREYTQPTLAPLTIKSNVYWAGSRAVSFVWIPDFYENNSHEKWVAAYRKRYGVTDTSSVMDPKLTDMVPAQPVQGLPGFASRDFTGKVRTRATIGAYEQ